MKKAIALFVSAAVVYGCGSGSDSSATSSSTSAPKATADRLSGDKPVASTTTPPESKSTDDKSQSDTRSVNANDSSKPAVNASNPVKADLPKELVHEGYEYEGLANRKPIDMELTVAGRGDVITGSQSITFDGMKDGKASYRVERTGGLSSLGSDTISVEKDGVYNLKSSVASLSNHAMDLPANPKPGMTWQFHVNSQQKDSQMDMATTCKVIGIQSVTTKGGKYDKALLVEQDSTGLLAGKNVRTVSRSWYVKGIGTVKADLTTHNADGSTQTLTIQETHH